jgi:nicotinamidase-related amidase
VATSDAVDSTARDAEDRDFNVVVLSGGCADRPHFHQAALERIQLSFGQVMTSHEFVEVIRHS